MATAWHKFWMAYHRVWANIYRKEGAFQSHRFITHRNKLKKHKIKLTQS